VSTIQRDYIVSSHLDHIKNNVPDVDSLCNIGDDFYCLCLNRKLKSAIKFDNHKLLVIRPLFIVGSTLDFIEEPRKT